MKTESWCCPVPDPFRPPEREIGRCAKCGVEDLKRNMRTLFVGDLGNQINQGFALLYLDGMDKMIKHELGIEYYGRYMDDFYLIHPNKEYVKYCLDVIRAYLDTLELTLNGKTQIFPFKNGVSYLGFHTYIAADGTPIRRLRNQSKRNAQRKSVKMARLVAEGKLSEKKFRASYQARKNHISHGNCYRLGRALDEKIESILCNDKD